jgi:hypothetical protein
MEECLLPSQWTRIQILNRRSFYIESNETKNYMRTTSLQLAKSRANVYQSIHYYQSQAFPNSSASRSSHSLSTASKPFLTLQSMSIIATTFPPTEIGTTTSLMLSPSQAICPGNSSTSGTSCVCCVEAAVPQTPRPKAMVWHATFPWKGPSMSWGFDGEEDGSMT